jgi:glutathione peroxidase
MVTRRLFLKGAALMSLGGITTSAVASDLPTFQFPSIDGGTYDTAKWRGKPVLVVNTASMCGFTPQYTDLQALSDALGDKAVVLAVPSDDFNQELGTSAAVKEFCELNFALTLPMTTIQHVAAGEVHPFYAWVAETQGFVPGWNFNKVLIGADGAFVQAWGSMANPMASDIRGAMEALIAA